MTNLPDKYVVRRIIDSGDGQLSESKPFPREEYFVLRKQDLLASHALWAYVQVLHLACDLLPNGPEKAQLAITADGVADMAYEWENHTSKKLPD